VRPTTTLPTNYRHQATLDLSKSRLAFVGAIVSGIVLLILVGWLLLQFAHLVRPAAFEGPGLGDILTMTTEGNTSITLPFQPILVALVLVTVIHELVHGLFYWRSWYRWPFCSPSCSLLLSTPREQQATC
jgi:hypothetical protein